MKIIFPYIAQLHQVMHSLPIAAEIATAYPDVEVHVAGPSEDGLLDIQRILLRHAPQANLQYWVLGANWIDWMRPYAGGVPWKLGALFCNRDFFEQFDAIVTPERTSLFLRRFGVTRPRLIWTRHGAGDRRIGFAGDVGEFDFVCMAGSKIENRLAKTGLIEAGRYVSGVYAKFDWTFRAGSRWTPFDNDRPTVLYSPHFKRRLSSWPALGRRVLDFFAGNDQYNLIFAPHVRLFDRPTASKYRAFDDYKTLSNIHVDLGSERCIDMSYTEAADIYLGDVSSQVAEFVRRPRPCIFIDAHHTAWRGDDDYRFWTLGPVIESVDELGRALAEARETHSRYAEVQRQYAEQTFQIVGGRSAPVAAAAILHFLTGVLGERVDALRITDGHAALP